MPGPCCRIQSLTVCLLDESAWSDRAIRRLGKVGEAPVVGVSSGRFNIDGRYMGPFIWASQSVYSAGIRPKQVGLNQVVPS